VGGHQNYRVVFFGAGARETTNDKNESAKTARAQARHVPAKCHVSQKQPHNTTRVARE
jgi:hypothetical protein